MNSLLAMIIFGFNSSPEILQLTHNEDIIQPRYVHMEEDKIFVLDLRAEVVWVYQQGSISDFPFSWGQGPGELTRNITNFYINEGMFWLIHANGTRVSKFDSGMGYLENLNHSFFGSFIFTSEAYSIFAKHEESSIIVRDDRQEIAATSILPDEDMGFPLQYAAKRGGNHVMVTTTTSSVNTIGYAYIDLATGTVKDQGTFEPRLKTDPKDIPNIAKDMQFFAVTVQNLSFHPEEGFILVESAINAPRDYLILRKYNKEKKAWIPEKFSVKNLPSKPTLFQPLGEGKYFLCGQEYMAIVKR